MSFVFSLFILASCSKNFLDQKPSTDIVSPKTLEDYMGLIEYSRVNFTAALPILASDEYTFLLKKDWQALRPVERNSYIWAADLYETQQSVDDWNYPYESLFYANSVIDGLQKLERTADNQKLYDEVLGRAYFARAFAFFDLAKNFAPPYDDATADKDLGIPLKTSPNIDETLERASLKSTYAQIISDLQMAINLLEINITAERNRSNKPAAYALGARIHLSMRKYEKAEAYADSCLNLYKQLIDYNGISLTASTPFTNNNEESMLYAVAGVNYSVSLYASTTNMSIAKELYDLYDADDLRKSIFFEKNLTTGLIKTKRGYSGTNRSVYSGLSTDEVYLIKAECAARRNAIDTAKKYLDDLLIKRYRTNSFSSVTFTTQAEALATVLTERRKELVWRAGLRWDDIRRLNKEGSNIVLTRNLEGEIYSIAPNSGKYVFPIPPNEIAISRLEQNIR